MNASYLEMFKGHPNATKRERKVKRMKIWLKIENFGNF